MRLIDADALKQELESYGILRSLPEKLIDNAPTKFDLGDITLMCRLISCDDCCYVNKVEEAGLEECPIWTIRRLKLDEVWYDTKS